MTADEPMSTPDSGGLRETVIQRLTETIEHEKRWAVMGREGDVRCLSCDLRYAERQEYGCHWEGNAHSYDDEELAEARSEQHHDADSLMVDALAALLAAHPEQVPTPSGAWVCSQCGERQSAMVKIGTSDGWCTRCLDEAAEPVPAPDGADDAMVGEREAVASDYTPPMDRIRDEYVEMRRQHYGFADLYAAEFDRALAARDAAWVERLAAVEGERDRELRHCEALCIRVGNEITRAEAAEAERDTARREAGERIAQAIEALLLDVTCPDPFDGRNHTYSLSGSQVREAAARIARADARTSDDGSGA